LLKRAGFLAAGDVAEEFEIDVRPRTPAGPQAMLEKVQKGMGMALRPARILRRVPGMVEFGGRGGAGLGAGEIQVEQAAARDLRPVAEPVGIEEGVGAIAAALADERVMGGSERGGEFA